jgi:hypothetical protein
MRILLTGILGTASAGVVVKNAWSGPAVPLMIPGENEPKWVRMNMRKSESFLHSSNSCPALLNCDIRDKLSLSFGFPGGSQVNGLDWQVTDLPFSEYPDVIGAVGLGPYSKIAYHNIVYFRKQKEGTILQVFEEKIRDPKEKRFEISRDSESWSFPGYLGIDGFLDSWKMGIPSAKTKDNLKEILVDFSSNGIAVPESLASNFEKQKGWSVHQGRLYVDSRTLKSPEGHLFDFLITHKKGRRIRVPVRQISSDRNCVQPEQRRQDCPTNLVFAPENRVVIGKAVLWKYDVLLDGRGSEIAFLSKKMTNIDIENVGEIPFPALRFRYESPDFARDRDTGRVWEFVHTQLATVQENDFYIMKLPEASDEEFIIHLFCVGESCSSGLDYSVDRWFKQSWQGVPEVSYHDGKVRISEKYRWEAYEIKTSISGDIFEMRFSKKGYRAELNPHNSEDGYRLEFVPVHSKPEKPEFIFVSWPPVLIDGHSIKVFFESGHSAYANAITRWVGNPLIELENGVVVIRSDVEEGAIVPERALTLRYNSLVFASERRFRYCVHECSEARIRFVSFERSKRDCDFAILVDELDGSPNPVLTGTHGRFSIDLHSIKGRISFPSSLEGLAWIGDPQLIVDHESGEMAIVPSTGSRQIGYNLITVKQAKKNDEYATLGIEFIAKRPRFRFPLDGAFEYGKFRFWTVKGTASTQEGEFMLNLNSDSPEEPIAFTRSDGALEIVFSQVVPFSDSRDGFGFDRGMKWYGVPRIRIDDNQLVIQSDPGATGPVYTIRTMQVWGDEIVLRFEPFLGGR